jgi:hypothetical protein
LHDKPAQPPPNKQAHFTHGPICNGRISAQHWDG